MKKLLLLALLAPYISFGQKWDVSEMGGYSNNVASPYLMQKASGLANQVAANYHVCKHFSVGAYHQLDGWKPVSNSFGLMADVHLRHIYFGATVARMFFARETLYEYLGDFNVNSYIASQSDMFTSSWRPNAATAVGVHGGVAFDLSKHIVFREQISYTMATSKGCELGDNYTLKIAGLSVLGGIAYRF